MNQRNPNNPWSSLEGLTTKNPRVMAISLLNYSLNGGSILPELAKMQAALAEITKEVKKLESNQKNDAVQSIRPFF